MNNDIEMAKRLLAKGKTEVSQAVASAAWQEAEEYMLEDTMKKVAENLGKQAWRRGLSGIDDAHIETEETSYNKLYGVGIFADAEHKETMRQWMYQFVKLAEDYQNENMVLRDKLKKIAQIAHEGHLE